MATTSRPLKSARHTKSSALRPALVPFMFLIFTISPFPVLNAGLHHAEPRSLQPLLQQSAPKISEVCNVNKIQVQQPGDTVQREFVITRSTPLEELKMVQQAMSEHHYELKIEKHRFAKNILVQLAGYVKHKDAAVNNNSFSITNFETFKIVVNKNGEKGKIELEWIDFRPR